VSSEFDVDDLRRADQPWMTQLEIHGREKAQKAQSRGRVFIEPQRRGDVERTDRTQVTNFMGLNVIRLGLGMVTMPFNGHRDGPS
jgi:hypothetical protein